MKILVLAGGDSAERDVSLKSGECVAAALKGAGHFVEIIDPAITDVESLAGSQWEIAFPMVHGTGGEDGKMQHQLDQIDLMYVGSSATASELTFDKIRTNELLKLNHLPVADNLVLSETQSPSEHLSAVRQLGFPVVTKPPRQGSSIGVSIVTAENEVRPALLVAFEFAEECLVEKFIEGREVTVPVIDGRAYPAIEIRPAEAWYDYQSKYQDDRTEYFVAPPNVDSNVANLATKACEVCDVAGIARVDFRIDTNGEPWILEINTIPGMTSHSLVPKSAAHLGQSLADVCELAVRNRLDKESR